MKDIALDIHVYDVLETYNERNHVSLHLEKRSELEVKVCCHWWTWLLGAAEERILRGQQSWARLGFLAQEAHLPASALGQDLVSRVRMIWRSRGGAIGCWAEMDTHLSDLFHGRGLIVHLRATAIGLCPVVECDSFVSMNLGQEESWVTRYVAVG